MHVCCAQEQTCKEHESYYLTQAENCFSNFFNTNGVDKLKFKRSFEQYFVESNLVEKDLSKGKLYIQILEALEKNPDKLPPVKQKDYVFQVAKKLKLTVHDFEQSKQLDCLVNQYYKYREVCPLDNKSGLYVVGDVSRSMQEIENIHYQFIAYTLVYFTNEKDFENKALQDAVVMLFWFQIASRYGG